MKAVYLIRCTQVTNQGLYHLHNVEALDLRHNQVITSEGLRGLNARFLSLRGCHNMTNDILKWCSKVQILNLRNTLEQTTIDDDGLQYLEQVEYLELRGNSNITDAGLEYLSNVKWIDLGNCNQITGEGFKYLKKVETLIIDHLEHVTDDKLDVLCELKVISVYGAKQITSCKVTELQERGIIVLNETNFDEDIRHSYLKKCDIKRIQHLTTMI